MNSQEDVLLCVRTAVADIFKRDIELITLDTNFSTDSSDDILNFVELIMCLEDQFDIRINDKDANTIKTVRDAFRLICVRLTL